MNAATLTAGIKIVTTIGNTYEVIRVLGDLVLVKGARRSVHIDSVAYVIAS